MYTIYENKGLVTLEIAENVAKEKRLPQYVIFNDKFDLACYVIKHGLIKDYKDEQKMLTIINSKLINTLFKNGL